MKKMYIKESFATGGKRYVAGRIDSVPVSKISQLKSEGFIEDVSKALGVECEGEGVDLRNYVTLTQLEEMKPSLKGEKGDTGATGAKGEKGDTGAKGADGFPSQEQWEALVARVEALESVGASVIQEPTEKASKKA